MNPKALKIIKELAKIKGKDCVGGFYAIYEVEESLVEEAKQFVKDYKKQSGISPKTKENK
jgi:hypothetical protein